MPYFAMNAKVTYTYKLEKFSVQPYQNFVYPNVNQLYSFVVKLNSSPNGGAKGKFKIVLENAKFDDGEVEKEFYENNQINIIYDDVVNQYGIIKITSATAENATTDSLVAGTPTQISYFIASLKGQIPNMTVSANPNIGSKQTITAQINNDIIYPGIYVDNGWGGSTNLKAEYYEWTLPANWSAAGQDGSTFILSSNQKSITITPDYVTAGEVTVRAVNGLKSAGSETKSNKLDRGFYFTNFPMSIMFGDNTAKTFTTTLFNGITYEWSSPSGWQVNGQGNTMEALNMNSVNVTPSFCSQIDDRVRVRLKKDGDVSPWYDCKSYQGVLKPNTIGGTSTIYQYEEVPFSINNINMAGVQSISCVDNNVVFTGNKDSGFKIVFLDAGTFAINVSILMSGCSTPTSLPLAVKVLPHRIQLSVSSYVCPSSTATVTINNAPSNYTWGHSTNLTPISGSSGNFTTSFIGGTAWVSINAYGKECARKNFIIGSQITGINQIVYVQTNRYYADPACSNQNNIWVLSWQGMNILTEKPDTVYGKNYVDVVSTTSPNHMTTYDLSLIQDNGYRPVKYIAVNGVKLRLVGIKKPNPFPPIELLLYPNPVADILSVEIKNDDADSDNATLARNTNTNIESYTIQLWNERQGLMRTIEITESIQQISLQGLPNGMYFVHVIKDGKMLQRKIIWKN